jgi:hypothetical protein
VTMQLCARCQREKPEADFCPNKRGKAGHYCNPCQREYRARWRENNYRDVRGAKRGLPRHRVFIEMPKVPGKPREPSTSYRAVHKRITKAKGPARLQQCGCGAQAEHWAYDHTDPAPLRGLTERGVPAEYSVDLTRYQAMCRPCHARFDAGRSSPTLGRTDPPHRAVTSW